MIYDVLQELINYGIKNNLIEKEDEIVVRNQLIDTIGLESWENPEKISETRSIQKILDDIIEYSCKNGIIPETNASKDLFDTKIMGIFTPLPSSVRKKFYSEYENSPKNATEWYYKFSKDVNYVRSERIEKDIKWKYNCEYGELDITINMSKPEKDPRDIANAKKSKAVNYPKCQLCLENEGYAGRSNHPARQNLRPVPVEVLGKEWYLQYSPYGYYNEHCILFNKEHTPMVIDKDVFGKLFDFVEKFPHYFIGSNADLPIVGGSILTHEHFQGGNYTFAMAKAPVEYEFKLDNYPDVKSGIVKWPMSVIRLSSENRQSLEKASAEILEKWRKYTDADVSIYAETDGEPHNTITPIARKKGDIFEIDLVLRNNLTTEERPFGLYHPNESLHHIKKENIGLIEVMGLAVLPSRLSSELEELRKAMLECKNIYQIDSLKHHAEWADEVKAKHPEFNEANSKEIIETETGLVFKKVLEDSGVFKRNEEGKKAFIKFTETL
mgnify:FL=1